ncbi:MAG: CTP synthetase [Candidatus Moranbacteria bacterium GW2011_GWE1_35_17]|nr:MAG: CTP synthetase [Candidatus Moranbacteria bacterium GW2011_GWE1_35_17]KKP82591.1 MAG: CTP synthetase [Candidatus Moranbacteria bacterium GW2011_GWF2_35_54]KKP84487.1 MAG: CTP synthetase [Candidatus Moranbacteria bacterium GW2011_GWF1_35_5]
MKKNNKKYIFVLGGVMSGIGKGIATSSLGAILKARGYKPTAIKIDPYVNVDAGTMNPTEHGEVFVMDCGLETDQDMGNYERFMEINLPGENYMTTGSIYQKVINRERNLEYKGKCVQIIPHVTDEVIRTIKNAAKNNDADVVLIEIGGTIGDYENMLFMEAARQMKLKNPKDVVFVMITYLPYPPKVGEMKTKPTQQAVRELNANGINPDIIIARSEVALDKKRKEKIALFCNVNEKDIISAPDIETVYEVPINFERDDLSRRILKKLDLPSKKTDLKKWFNLVENIKKSEKSVKIGIVGKYFGTGEFMLGDSYISVIEAIKHACYKAKVKPQIEWFNSEEFEKKGADINKLKAYDGIVVPGGFGSRGIEGKINVIKYCRENKIPFLGLCYGMQMAVIEFSRNVLKLKDANSSEIDRKSKYQVIDIMPEQKKNLEDRNYGATMRLGAYKAFLEKDTIAYRAYGKKEISERHRHRWEVNPDYIERLEKGGLVFSGKSADGRLMEITELPKSKHPFFLGTQFHPEFKSTPLSSHPLFFEFIKAAKK